MAAGSAGGLGCVSTSTPHVFNPKMAEPLKISFQLLDLGSVTSKFNLQGLMFFHSLMFIVPKQKSPTSVLTVAVKLKL